MASVTIANAMFAYPIRANVSVLVVKKVFSVLNSSFVMQPAISIPNGIGARANPTWYDAFLIMSPSSF